MLQPVTRLLSAWPMVTKSSLAGWRLLSAVVIGVVLASAIMAGTVVYFDSLRDLALRSELARRDAKDLDILAKATKGPTSRDDYLSVRERIEAEYAVRVGSLLRGTIRGGNSATFFVTESGQEERAGEDNSRGFFAFILGVEQHVRVLPGGRSPVEMTSPVADGSPVFLEALVPAVAAEQFGLGVGDAISAIPHWSDVTPYASVVIAGLYERIDPSAMVWQLNDRVFDPFGSGNFRSIQFLVSESTFLEGVGGAFKEMDSTYGWLLDVDTGRLTASNASRSLSGIRTLGTRLQADLQAYRQSTTLDDALVEYDRRLLFSKLQMFVVLILIAVVVLYYVVTLSSLVAEQRRGEIALLRSRGAGSGQILAVFVLEGATIAVLATVVAPLLAAAAVSFLGYTPAFSDLSGGARLPVRLGQGAFTMSALGGLLSFGALMAPAIEASRQGVTRFRQDSARPSRLAIFQRYYLDVMLLAVGILLFRQLGEQGSLAATDLMGDVVVNQLLLVAPAITLVAAAMVLLRVFPVVMGLASRLLSPHLPVGLVIGLWQMSRNPTHYARLALLLILMSGLGIFAASFGGTLERSFRERVFYSSGSDLRLLNVSQNSSGVTRPFARGYELLDGVERASPALRKFGTDLSKLVGGSFEMLAVDSSSFAEVAWYRDDFSDDSLDGILASLNGVRQQLGVPLPGDTRTIEVFLKSDRAHPTVSVTARIKDANDRYFNYSLGFLQTTNWRVMSANLFERRRFRFRLRPTGPLTLVSIAVHETNRQGSLRPGAVLIDSVRARRANGEVTVIDPFTEVDGWNTLRKTDDAVEDRVRASRVSAKGDGSLMFAWSAGSPLTARGIYPGPRPSPAPVVASASFLRGSGHGVGDEIEVSVGGQRIQVRIEETVDFFPTLDTFNESYLIADLDTIISRANLGRVSGELSANEMWLTTSLDEAERLALVEELSQGSPFPLSKVIDRARELDAAKIDPLVLAGWRALLLIAFGAIVILSSLGFLVHAYVSFRNRELEFALMRTIGISLRQLVALMWLEQALVIAVGMVLGTWMGGRLGATVMPFLGNDDQGSQVLPPFVIEASWRNLSVTYIAMAVIFVAIILGVIWFVRRMALSRVLRIGDI